MYRLPAAALWILAFAAVIGHFPALGFDFAGPDFAALARGAGLGTATGWPAYPWTDLGIWNLWWRVAGADPSVPHGTAVALIALDAVLIALVGARIGLPRAGAVSAAALWLLGPATSLAAACVSAGGELWVLLFGLAGLRLWMGVHPRRDPPVAALLLILAAASGPAGLFLAPLCGLAWRWFGPVGESMPVRRGRVGLLVLVFAVAGATLVGALTHPGRMPSGPGPGPGAAAIPDLFVRLGSSAWSWPFAPGPLVTGILGLALAGAVIALLVRTRGRPAPRLRFALLWIGGSLAPYTLVPEGAPGSGSLAATVGLAWAVGALAGPALEEALHRLRLRVGPGDALVLVTLLLVVGPGWALLRTAALGQTDAAGRLRTPALHQTAVTAGVRRILEQAMASPSPPAHIAFLQATRLELPEGAEVPEGQEVILTSPVYTALHGTTGPRLILADRATVRWTTLLDQVSPDAFVLLDVGDDRVRPLGPVENARIYAALIAVAGGQFDLARHEFWSVVEMQGARVRFAFDPDHLPIAPAELDAEAPDFARGLKAEGTPAALRVLRLFASVYESVRGQPLIEEGVGGPLRSGRIDR